MRILFIVLAVVIVIAAAVLIVYCITHSDAPDKNPVHDVKIPDYCNYTVGGDMNGSYYNVRAVRDGDACVITVAEAEVHSDPFLNQTYTAGSAVFEKIAEVIEKYDAWSWSDLPNSEEFILDGATTSISIEFEDGTKRISFSDSKEIPDGKYAAFNEILNVMLDAAVNENTSLTLLTERTPIDYESDKAETSLRKYENGYLFVEVYNGTDKEYNADGKFTLSRDGEELVPVKDAALYNETLNLVSEFYATVQFDLNAYGKLAAGSYTLTTDYAEINFELGE